jgi:hypothetical protein
MQAIKLAASLKSGAVINFHMPVKAGETFTDKDLDALFDHKGLGQIETFYGRDATTKQFVMIRMDEVAAMTGEIVELT